MNHLKCIFGTGLSSEMKFLRFLCEKCQKYQGQQLPNLSKTVTYQAMLAQPSQLFDFEQRHATEKKQYVEQVYIARAISVIYSNLNFCYKSKLESDVQ